MATLRARLQARRAQLRLLLVLFCALILLQAGYRLVHQPLMRAREELQVEVEQRRREVAALRRLRAEEGALAARLRQAQERLAAIEHGLEAGRRQPSFLRYVEESAAAAGVAVTRLEFAPGEAVGETGYVRYAVTLGAAGPYPGLVELVDRLEDAAPFVTVGLVDASAAELRGLPDGWALLTLELAVLGQAEGTTDWDRELARWSLGPGRANPFAGRGALRPAAGEGE